MKTIYRADLKAHLTLDDRDRVRHIVQKQEYFLSDKSNARLAAADYLLERADTLKIPTSQLQSLHVKVSFMDPREQGIEYRQYQVKKAFSTVCRCPRGLTTLARLQYGAASP